jgi:hypothetical protein
MRGSGKRLSGNQGGSRRSRAARGVVCALLVVGALALPLGLGSAGADSLGGRMTGWGQDGPLAPTAGHDIDYMASKTQRAGGAKP